MSRPAALDTHSLEADVSLTQEGMSRVQAEIITILAESGPLTHDETYDQFMARAHMYAGIPRVTEQRVRTATAALVRRGLVTAAREAGVSRHGHKATRWTLA